MKTSITLKSFDDLPAEGVQFKDASLPAVPESPRQPDGPTDGDFHVTLRHRPTAPLVSAIPYHRWGINE